MEQESISGVFNDGLERVRSIRVEYGMLSFVTDYGIGYEVNQDRAFIDTEKNIFGVADGMGGYARGSDAAQIISEEILEGVKQGSDVELVQIEASERMRREGIREGGACYLYMDVREKEVNIVYAGDCALVIVGDHGEKLYTTKETPFDRAPRGKNPGKPFVDVLQLPDYSVAVLGSDGLWDNIDKEDVREFIQEMKTGETHTLVNLVYQKAISGMQHGFLTNYDGMLNFKRRVNGKEDNISIVVFQKLPKE